MGNSAQGKLSKTGSGIGMDLRLGNLRIPVKGKKKPKYKTAEALCGQILFEYPFLKSLFSGGNVTVGGGGGGAVVVADHYATQDDAIVWVSDGFEQLSLYSREDVLGTNCRFLQGPDSSPDAISSIRKALRAGESVQLEIVNYRKDGVAFWNNLRILPIHGPGKVSGTVFNFVAFLEDTGVLPDLSSKGNIYEWMARDVDVWLRRHKYGLYAKMFLEKGITGGMLAEIRKKDLKELIASCMKDSFMHSVIAADTDAIFALIRNQKKTAVPKLPLSSSSFPLPPQRTSSSSSNPMLSSGEGTESDDFDRERSEGDLDKRKQGGSWRSSDSNSSSDSADSWMKGLALSPAFNGRKSAEEQAVSPRRATQNQPPDSVAIKYVFEDREAVVILVPLWVTFAEFKQRIAFACGAPGWDFDMTWRVRMKNDEGHESGSYEVPTTTSSTSVRSISGENLRRNNPAPSLSEKKTAIIETETEWKNLLANAKGTILMYCSKPAPIQKVQQELDGPGIP